MAQPRRRADPREVNKKVLGMCILIGSTVGGYLPTFVGQGSMSWWRRGGSTPTTEPAAARAGRA
jgi:hypothetical protein